MSIKVFWLEPTDLVRVSLRRFTFSGDKLCRAKQSWGHDATNVIVDEALRHIWLEECEEGSHRSIGHELISNTDPRWPAECEACGEPFQDDDDRQVNAHELYRGAPDGKLYTLRDAPVGAMWDAYWYGRNMDWFRGPDGITLVVKTPGGAWLVDGEASNCTRTQYEAVDGGRRWTGRTHYCWVRHGDPRSGNIHVDKNGETCAAGAGSIIAGGWHGFLHHGHLVGC